MESDVPGFPGRRHLPELDRPCSGRPGRPAIGESCGEPRRCLEPAVELQPFALVRQPVWPLKNHSRIHLTRGSAPSAAQSPRPGIELPLAYPEARRKLQGMQRALPAMAQARCFRHDSSHPFKGYPAKIGASSSVSGNGTEGQGGPGRGEDDDCRCRGTPCEPRLVRSAGRRVVEDRERVRPFGKSTVARSIRTGRQLHVGHRFGSSGVPVARNVSCGPREVADQRRGWIELSTARGLASG